MDSAFWVGLAIFLVPAALFGWSTLTRRGRAAHARAAERAQQDAEGVPPPPPRTAVGRWAAGHPILAAATGAVATAVITFLLKTLVFDASAGDALTTAVIFGLEWLVIDAVIARRERPRPSAPAPPGR